MSSSSVSLNLVMRNPDEDYKLVEQSIAGNRDSFRDLFMKNVDRVHSLCLRISADIHLAEDLTQEVFIKAWEKLDTFKFECKFSTWLHSIAVNLFLTHVRSDKRYSEKLGGYKSELNPEEKKPTEDLKIDLQKAIDKLPEQAKAVLILHDIEGYKHNEISEMMSIQTGTSKAHLHRARRILREELSK
ncbi:MAG: RNA polymerase sigma factor [Ignavibacteria bacterium]|nr:RNA polymerase sigma factor [Ignavibacteriota bacterium]